MTLNHRYILSEVKDYVFILLGLLLYTFSGVTPEAMPKAMASGRATMPTMMPAMRSAVNVLRS